MTRPSLVLPRVLSFSFLLLLVSAIALPGLAATAVPLKGAAVVDAAWMAAMKANDVDAVMTNYADDATAWIPGGPRLDGKAAIREAFAGMLGANTIKDAVISNSRIETSGSLSAAWGQFTLTMVPKAGGADVVMRGHFTSVAVKRGGKWVYLVDHATDDPAPAAPPSGAAGH